MRANHSPSEPERLRIAAGLLRLAKAGGFDAVWIGDMIRVRYSALGPVLLLGWKRAAELVNAAETARKPPESERAERAQAQTNGKL